MHSSKLLVSLALLLTATGCVVKAKVSSDPAPRLGRELPELVPALTLNPPPKEWTSPHWKVVNFWHYFCPPCVKELPEIQRFAEANPEVEVVGVSYLFEPSEMPVREQLDHFRRVLLGRGVTYRSQVARSSQDLNPFEFVAIPSTLLVDPGGAVVAEIRSSRDIHQFLDQAARRTRGDSSRARPTDVPAAPESPSMRSSDR